MKATIVSPETRDGRKDRIMITVPSVNYGTPSPPSPLLFLVTSVAIILDNE